MQSNLELTGSTDGKIDLPKSKWFYGLSVSHLRAAGSDYLRKDQLTPVVNP